MVHCSPPFGERILTAPFETYIIVGAVVGDAVWLEVDVAVVLAADTAAAVVPVVVVTAEAPDPEEDGSDEEAVDVEMADDPAGGKYVCPRHASTEA